MLKLSGIKKSFAQKSILSDVCFNAPNGQLTILVGHNGSGKSTIFNIIAGLIHHDEGSIALKELDLGSLSARKRAFHIAMLKQDPRASSCPSLSIAENFALAALKGRQPSLRPALSSKFQDELAAHLKSLGLDFFQDLGQTMDELSGGQRQLLAFAMAIMVKPGLLLLDEPTAALDEHSSHLLMKLVKRFATDWQIPAVMISHDHAINQHYGDQIIRLEQGRIAAQKS